MTTSSKTPFIRTLNDLMTNLGRKGESMRSPRALAMRSGSYRPKSSDRPVRHRLTAAAVGWKLEAAARAAKESSEIAASEPGPVIRAGAAAQRVALTLPRSRHAALLFMPIRGLRKICAVINLYARACLCFIASKIYAPALFRKPIDSVTR
jgi:hypothetical protein